MKKNYFAPKTEIIELQSENLLDFTSVEGQGEAGTGSQGGGVNYSRESDWDE